VWQHLDYPAQLAEKRRRLDEALALVPAVAEGACASPRCAHRRRRSGTATKASTSRAARAITSSSARTHRAVTRDRYARCRVVAPVIDEVATWVRGAAEAAGLVAYEEAKREGELRYVIVREAADGDAMVVLVVAPRTPRAKLEQVANALSRHPAIRSVLSLENDRRDGAIVPSGSTAHVLLGKGTLVEEIAGAKVEVVPASFYR